VELSPGVPQQLSEVITVAKVPVVDEDACTGCELCCDTAADTFEMNDDGISVVKDPNGDPEDVIQEAIDDCPVEAISWKE
jgi:ferredoxin